jgi:light-regulated signal transduction histidine kinase (bacteriophytochrome)
VFVLASVVDISARKQAEEELRRSNEELERFAYVASHDLQEPLRTVASYVQLLARRYRDRLDQDATEFIDFAVDGAKRMQRLIEDLLAFSRVGTRGPAPVATSAQAALTSALGGLHAAIQDAGATVTYDPLPEVLADPGQLEQVFANLIGNALKFHGANPPEVHVSATTNGARCVFSVRDNGIGIDPQYYERIFVIFQRLHGREAYPGTGIGLAICKKIVARHGGRIWLESVPGEGTTFSFSLPTATEGT